MVDVVIVGGGAAGIGAARTLAAHDVDALLLEAGPRLGGRAHTSVVEGMALDLGAGWLHSADRNPWVAIADEFGLEIDRRRPAWGRQYRALGFPPAAQEAARGAFADWVARLADAPPASDDAADALPADPRWHGYIAALTGFISGVAPDRISAADFTAYDAAATDENWRVASGYGALVAGSAPAAVPCRCDTPVERVTLTRDGVTVATAAGPIAARAAILTVSTAVLTGGSLGLPRALDPWREAAARLPLGHNEKLFLGVEGLEEETQLLGDPHDAATGAYYIRPLGLPVIECFLGGAGAERRAREGTDAAFAHAADELAALLGSGVRARLRPLAASDWTRTATIGGGYSCALPGAAAARGRLAEPFDDRLFFAGEATHRSDFSTAHGALESGRRAAGEAIRALSRPGAGRRDRCGRSPD